MPRKRLHPDYPVVNYSYSCVLDGVPSQALWDTAHAMRELWNRLVRLHEDMRQSWTKTAPSSAVKHAAYETLLATHGPVYTACKQAPLSAWHKWGVHDRFQDAMAAFKKDQHEPPTIHRRLQHVIFPHRMDSPGVPLAWLWDDHPRKHTAILPADAGHIHRRGYMKIGGERIPFLVLLHRPIPDNAILKRVALVGVHEPHFRSWRWQFQCTVELPPETPKPLTHRSLGIDLGWRVCDYGIRVAMLHDGTQSWEVALPWDTANHATRRRQAFYAARGAQLQTTGSRRALWDWQARIDAEIDACKAAIAPLEKQGWPLEAQKLWSGHLKLKAPGLRRLRRHLLAADIRLEALDSWLPWHSEQVRRRRGCELHLHRQRNHYYRLVAAWIAAHFDSVCLEAELDLHELAQQPTRTRRQRGKKGEQGPLPEPDRILLKANKNRQMSGPSVLRQYICEAMTTHGRIIYKVPKAYTSRTCVTCQARLTVSLDVSRACPQGHVQDRDVAAAFLLWSYRPMTLAAVEPPAPGLDGPVTQVLHVYEASALAMPSQLEALASAKTTTSLVNEEDDIPEIIVPQAVLAEIAVTDGNDVT